jgi:hypothetical protein
MSIIKTPTLTVCSRSYLVGMLNIFDDAITKDPTISTEENRCLRKEFDLVLKRSIMGICIYNSRKMLKMCDQICKCKNPLE